MTACAPLCAEMAVWAGYRHSRTTKCGVGAVCRRRQDRPEAKMDR
ncbi:hypothetical protein HMPREF1546_00128 [Oscillibacter sp. KLE 1745]|nr:hypothetical protein HMPREF1546_00128 [Oscillibacter sp. KLE 1745]